MSFERHCRNLMSAFQLERGACMDILYQYTKLFIPKRQQRRYNIKFFDQLENNGQRREFIIWKDRKFKSITTWISRNCLDLYDLFRISPRQPNFAQTAWLKLEYLNNTKIPDSVHSLLAELYIKKCTFWKVE